MSERRQIGGWVLFLGMLIAFIGFALYYQQQTVWGFPTGIRPYGDIGLLTMGFGFVLIVVGLVLALSTPQVETKIVYAPLKKCPKCGKQYSGEEYEYCPTCGIELEPAQAS